MVSPFLPDESPGKKGEMYLKAMNAGHGRFRVADA
jgi:hypothetical protein